ncbi:mRNA-capping enzyme-like [Tropilaelaps mercedesae]|uniref:mRNA-capping enzyme n=1 Tax=Tropilaelaps mercedesae TaxID=418985 RepID=A0A1V9Y2D9_9ACAR|nr:mRNA-capping enzyme-like [Tropilaelaps mercedesae]
MAEEYAGDIPDRWLNCPNIGSLIADLFVPFKTPLDERHRKQIKQQELRWEPNDVIGVCKTQDIKLGLVIDLTNTKRYYKPEKFSSKNVGHKKIPCRGHNEAPDENAKAEFIQLCHGFSVANPGKAIGVHCTHGYNRTGYLICAYLVEVLQWNVGAAVKVFQRSRQPGIYKQDYIDDLAAQYGGEGDMPETPPRPTWEYAVASQSDDIERKMRSKEFMSGIPGVRFVDNPIEASEIQKMAAEMTGFRGSGFPGSQPVSMDMDNLVNLKMGHHVVSWKADGTRYMMVIAGRDSVYFLDRDNAVFKVDGIVFPRRKRPNEHLSRTLLDGEMVIDVHQGRNVPRYLIYDIVFFEEFRSIREAPFSVRVQCINREIIGERRNAYEQRLINLDSEPFRVRIKQFYDVTATEKFFGEKFRSQVSHEVDGLIFQPSEKPYKAGQCDYILKWKPPELNTIDFRLKVVVTKDEASPKETKGFLYVGGLNHAYGVLGKISKEERKLDGKIVECSIQQWIDKYNQVKRGWVILRERTDKSFPNGYRTAESVMKSISCPVTKDILFNFIKEQAVSDMQWHIPPNERTSQKSQQESVRPLAPAVLPNRAKQARYDNGQRSNMPEESEIPSRTGVNWIRSGPAFEAAELSALHQADEHFRSKGVHQVTASPSPI